VPIGNAQMNIAGGIREFAVSMRNHPAVIDGDRVFSYGELHERSNRLATALLASGIGAGDRVAFLCGNRAEYFEVAAGLAKAGMVLVPLNPRSPAREVTFIIRHSGASALILDDALADRASDAVESLGLKVVLSMSGTTLGPDYEQALAAGTDTDPAYPVSELDPFTIGYTSGTTADPKGVMISHRSRALTFLATALEWGLGPSTRTIAVAPMYHGAGFAFACAAVATGGTVSMLRSFDPEELLGMVERDTIDSVFLVPTHAHMIRQLGEPAIGRHDLSSLSVMYFNAAPLPQELKLWTLDTFPQVGVHELYGSTEAGVVTDLRPPDQRRKERCVGPPWFMTEVRIVDAEGDPVEPGEVGLLYSRSPFLMNGYWNNPEATEAVTTDDGFLTSGDLAVFDDEQFVYIVDRAKDMIISGGANVFPREIEEVLVTHASISEAAVIGRPSEKWGEEVAAIVVLAKGATFDEAALEQHCRKELADYKIPRSYEVVEALPRNAAGKTLKRELRETFGQPAG